MQRLIDAWFEKGRPARPEQLTCRTRDNWTLALYRYRFKRSGHRTPVVLCHGMGSNRWNMDGPGELSMARYLAARGYDCWVVELRGAGRSTRPGWWNGKTYDWTFEDYVHHDAPAILKTVLSHAHGTQVHWVGHSMGGMIAYALLMSLVQTKIASAVTLASPTMSRVGHPLLDFGIPYRSLLRLVPGRLPSGVASRLGAPFVPLLQRWFGQTVADLGWAEGNADEELLRTLMLTATEDLPASLLREFARWYDTKSMSDRYAMFDFSEHLERIRKPIFIIAGSVDGLTPPADMEYVYESVGSRIKKFQVVGREQGFRNDYSHADLVLGKHAREDVYPLVLDWLERRRRGAGNDLRAVRGRKAASRPGVS